MNTCLRGAFRMLAMETVWRRNVSGIDLLLLERAFQVVVVIGSNAIVVAQFAIFLASSSDQRTEL